MREFIKIAWPYLGACLVFLMGTILHHIVFHNGERQVWIPADSTQICYLTPAKNGLGGGYDCRDL